MKKGLLFVVFILLVSCTKWSFSSVAPMTGPLAVETKSIAPKGTDSFLVSGQDLSDYIKFRSLELNEKIELKRVDSLRGGSGNPVAFALNYDNGWEIVSADKRTTPRLAYSEDGELNLDQCPATQKAWIESIMDEITVLQRMSEAQLNGLGEESMEEIARNIEFWEAITASESYIQRKGNLRGNSSIGYYELDGVIVDTLEYEVVNHLISVHWHQNAPYNNYCPLRTDYPNLRAPAGCSAIAMAQVLWYLHMHYGYPVYSPDSASVTGNVDDYTMTQSGQSSSIWGTMFINGDNAAILVAKVGTMVGMQYGNTASSAFFSDYKPLVFSPFGVDCSVHNAFDPIVAGNNLMDGVPVLARAQTADNEGHAFVVDGYKAYHVGHGLRYIWVSTDPSPDPQVVINPVIEVYSYYEDPYVREFSMNWGWGQSYDNGWYTTTGSWTAGGDSFDFGKRMLANFTEN